MWPGSYRLPPTTPRTFSPPRANTAQEAIEVFYFVYLARVEGSADSGAAKLNVTNEAHSRRANLSFDSIRSGTKLSAARFVDAHSSEASQALLPATRCPAKGNCCECAHAACPFFSALISLRAKHFVSSGSSARS